MSEPLPKSTSEREQSDLLAKHHADQQDWQRRATEAQSKAAQAYARLLLIAEDSDSGQARRVALFLAATNNGQDFPFDLFELRALDVAISDDMLVCIDALRWGKADLGNLVPDGFTRVGAVIQQWGLQSISK
jgi:hypothetical protein